MLYNEDCKETISKLQDKSIDLVITSPPYFGLRKYGDEEIGREETPALYVSNLVEIIDSLRTKLKDDGNVLLNIGDTYFGTKGFSRNTNKFKRKTDSHYKEHKICKTDGGWLQHKQLLLLPPRIAIGLQERGWLLRNTIVWEKTNAMPSYSPDRRLPCWEYWLHLVPNKKNYFNYELAKSINHHRDVFRTSVKPFGRHPASFSEEVIEPFIKCYSVEGGLVYDPFMGSGTTAIVCEKNKRKWIGSEINKEYVEISKARIEHYTPKKDEPLQNDNK